MEGRITEFLDQSAISQQGDFFKKLLDDIFDRYQKIKETKITLEGSKSFSDAAKSVGVLKKNTDELTVSINEYRKVSDSVTTTQAKRSVAESDLNKKLLEEKLLLQQSTREEKLRTQERLAAAGSVDQLRAKLGLLQIAYDKLPEAERQAAGGKELLSSIDQLDKKVKELEGSTGRFQRNVGNYANAFASALNPLQQSLNKIRSDINSNNFSGDALESLQKQENLLIQITEQLGQEFSSTRQQSRAFQEAVAQIGVAFGEDSKIFADFRNQVGHGVDALNDIRDSIKLAASDTGKLDLLINATQALAGGFGVAQGAAALFGDQNEDLQKTFVKLQAVMTILNGLQAIQQELKNKDSIIRKVSNFLYSQEIKLTNADAVAKRADAAATETATTATKGFGAALKSIGIGVLLTVISLLLTSFTAMGAKTQEVNRYFGETDEKSKRVADSLKSMGDTMSDIADSVIQELDSQINSLNDELGLTPSLLDKAKESLKGLKEQLKDQLGAFSFTGLDAIQKTVQQINDTKTKTDKLAKEQEDKRNADQLEGQTKLLFDSYRTQANLAIDKNNRILGSDKSTYAQQLAALRDNLRQQKSIIQQDLNESLLEAGPDEYKQKSARAKANADIVIAQRTLNDQIRSLNEKYQKYDDDALRDRYKARLEFIKDNAKAIADNESNNYNLRLGALKMYEEADAKLIELERKDKLSAAKTEEQRTTIEKDAQDKLTKVHADGAKQREAIMKQEIADRIQEAEQIRKQFEGPAVDTQALNEAEKALIDDQVAMYQHGFEETAKLKQANYLDEQSKLHQQYADGLISEREYQIGIANLQRSFAKDTVQTYIDLLEKQLKLLQPGTDAWDEMKNKIAEAKNELESFNEKIPKLGDNANENLKQLEKTLDVINQYTQQLSDLFLNIADVGITKQKNALQEVEDQQQKNYEQEVQNIQNSTLSEEDKANRLKILEAQRAAQKEQYDRKERQMETTRARFQKAADIAHIITETAAAVVHQLASGDPYTAIARAIAVGAFGAAQLAVAIATPIPKYKKGTKDHKGGLAEVGDGGVQEVVQTPDGDVFLTPAKSTVIEIPKHTVVYPSVEDFRKNAFAAVNRQSIPEYRKADYSADIAIGMRSMNQRLVSLENTIKNKRELHMDFNSMAIEAMYRHAQSQYKYMNDQLHFGG